MIKAKKFFEKSKPWIVLGFMLLMISDANKIISCAQSAMFLCAKKVLPSVFPFMTAAAVFTSSADISSSKTLSFFTKNIFGMSAHSVLPVICGILCGYPTGAISTCALYERGLISKSEAESLIAFSNNSSPLFVIGTVGFTMLGSAKIGAALYAIHIFSAIVCAAVLKPFTVCKNFSEKKSVSHIPASFTDSVCQSVISSLKVCGFVVIFAVISEILSSLPIFGEKCACAVNCILEITNGCGKISALSTDMNLKCALAAATLSWAGFSVHMQIKSIIAPFNLSMKKYYITRPLSCAVSFTTAYFAFGQKFKAPLPHFAKALLLISVLIFIAVMVTQCMKKAKQKQAHRT